MADIWLRRERDGWVAPNATISGDVILGPEVNVWYGASIRGDEAKITIGARTNIQDNAVIHCDPGEPQTIGDDCTIGHGAILHGSKIGNRCLVGMGAIVLQKAEIGDECLIGAGAVVKEGAKIPARSVVLGVPGEVARKVTDDEAKGFVKSAKGYVDLASETAGEKFRRYV